MVLARRIIELMLLRLGPEDMPGDQTILAASMAAYCILLFIQAALVTPLAHAALQAILATALLALYLRTVLRLRGVPNRFPQTAVAIFVSGAVLTLIMLVPTRAIAPYLHAISQAKDPQSVTAPPPILMLAYVALGIWGLAIYSHIYRRALDGSIWLGVGATLAFEVILLMVLSVFG